MAAGKDKDAKIGSGCLVLFGLPFAAVGVVMAGLNAKTLVTAARMWRWEEVPAQILSAQLESHQGSKSTTYSVAASYAYQYQGNPHKASRVGLHSGSDNVGSYHRDIHAELERYRKSGKPFRCYVNPDNPAEAVLYRRPRWGLIGLLSVFGLLFGGVGVGIIAMGLYAYRRGAKETALQAEHPEEPWRWKPEWQDGVIKAADKGGMIFACAFAAVWNAIAVPIAVLAVGDVLKGQTEKQALLVLLFPAAGLALAAWAVRSVVRWRKFGQSVFEMASVPGVLGEGANSLSHYLRADRYPRLLRHDRCVAGYAPARGRKWPSHRQFRDPRPHANPHTPGRRRHQNLR
ncbi:MAG: DUF3592 domain-containing protein [Kiritimatiellae bacterium]|nr:DUF3592 domain-containing protein [Kiritimatiellia bacterium]